LCVVVVVVLLLFGLLLDTPDWKDVISCGKGGSSGSEAHKDVA